jgi:DNA-binding MarR family transcriptional regulator
MDQMTAWDVADDDEDAAGSERTTAPSHLEAAVLVEKLGRRYLDLVRVQLRRLGLDDVSPSQMMMLLSVGPGEISVNDILARGGYVGSNTSHSLKQLVERDYLDRNSSPRDRRLARISLTEKGRTACALFRADDADRFGDLDRRALETTRDTLRHLEDLWVHVLRFGAIALTPCFTSSFIDALRVSSFI